MFTFTESHNPLKPEQCLSPLTHSKDPHTIPLLYKGFHSRHSLSSRICLWLHLCFISAPHCRGASGKFYKSLKWKSYQVRDSWLCTTENPRYQISAWESFQLGHALHFALISRLANFSIWGRISKLSRHSQTASFLVTSCASKNSCSPGVCHFSQE